MLELLFQQQKKKKRCEVGLTGRHRRLIKNDK